MGYVGTYVIIFTTPWLYIYYFKFHLNPGPNFSWIHKNSKPLLSQLFFLSPVLSDIGNVGQQTLLIKCFVSVDVSCWETVNQHVLFPLKVEIMLHNIFNIFVDRGKQKKCFSKQRNMRTHRRYMWTKLLLLSNIVVQHFWHCCGPSFTASFSLRYCKNQ